MLFRLIAVLDHMIHLDIEDYGDQLYDAGERNNQSGLVHIVKQAHQCRSSQECQAISCIKHAIACAALLKRRYISYCGAHDGFMNPHNDSEDHHTGNNAVSYTHLCCCW